MNTLRRTCSQCGSALILVSAVTERREGSLFPETTSIYRCSNKECQEKKDQETTKRIQMREEKTLDQERRKKSQEDSRRIKI